MTGLSFATTLQEAGRLATERPAPLAAAGLADYYDDITRQSIARAEHELGSPPTDYAWLSLGSHARRELSLASDQDNAIVLADGSPDAIEFGRRLAERVVADLQSAGLRRCDGNYMATTWCHSLADWRSSLQNRFADPTPQALIDASVFLDLRPIHGMLDTGDLLETLLRAAASARLLQGLARAAVTFPVGLTPFGRMRLVSGRFDTKKGALAPLVMLSRLYGLAAGTMTPSTTARLQAAEQSSQLSSDSVHELVSAYTVLTRLRLHQQLDDAQRGQPIDDTVPRTRMTREDESLVHRSLRSVRVVQQATALRFRTRGQA